MEICVWLLHMFGFYVMFLRLCGGYRWPHRVWPLGSLLVNRGWGRLCLYEVGCGWFLLKCSFIGECIGNHFQSCPSVHVLYKCGLCVGSNFDDL